MLASSEEKKIHIVFNFMTAVHVYSLLCELEAGVKIIA